MSHSQRIQPWEYHVFRYHTCLVEKNKITKEFAPRYRKASKAGKTGILNTYLVLVESLFRRGYQTETHRSKPFFRGTTA